MLKSSTRQKMMKKYPALKKQPVSDKQRSDWPTRIQESPNQTEESPCANKRIGFPKKYHFNNLRLHNREIWRRIKVTTQMNMVTRLVHYLVNVSKVNTLIQSSNLRIQRNHKELIRLLGRSKNLKDLDQLLKIWWTAQKISSTWDNLLYLRRLQIERTLITWVLEE